MTRGSCVRVGIYTTAIVVYPRSYVWAGHIQSLVAVCGAWSRQASTWAIADVCRFVLSVHDHVVWYVTRVRSMLQYGLSYLEV